MEQNPLWAALAMTILAGLSTGLGGLLVLWAAPSQRLLGRALGFAAGVMLAVSLADLLPGSLEFFAREYSMGPAGALCGALMGAGMLLAAWMQRLLPEEEQLRTALARPGGEEMDQAARAQALRCGLAAGLALVLHNLPEGILTLFSGIQDPRTGLRLSLAIALHNLPEGVSTAAPIWYATHSRIRSAGAAFLSGLAEPAGALLAYFALAPLLSPQLLQGLTILTAGVMCWVSVAELLFGGFELGHKRDTAAGFAAGLCGMILGIALLA